MGYFKFKFISTILVGEKKKQELVATSAKVFILREKGNEFSLSEAKEYFLKTKRIRISTGRVLTLKKVLNRSIYNQIEVCKRK